MMNTFSTPSTEHYFKSPKMQLVRRPHQSLSGSASYLHNVSQLAPRKTNAWTRPTMTFKTLLTSTATILKDSARQLSTCSRVREVFRHFKGLWLRYTIAGTLKPRNLSNSNSITWMPRLALSIWQVGQKPPWPLSRETLKPSNVSMMLRLRQLRRPRKSTAISNHRTCLCALVSPCSRPCTRSTALGCKTLDVLRSTRRKSSLISGLQPLATLSKTLLISSRHISQVETTHPLSIS